MTQRLFLFDLDGTLVDSAPDLAGAMNEMLAARGLPERPLEELREPSGHGGPALLKAAFGMERTDPRFEAMRQEFLERYAARATRSSTLYPNVVQMLDRLTAAGVKLGVVTNKPQGLAEIVCEHLGLTPRMTVVVGLGPAGTALKPKPDSLIYALKLAGAKAADALYAGDSNSDGLACQPIGLPFAWVSWGCQKTPPDSGIFDYIADEPAQLVEWALFR